MRVIVPKHPCSALVAAGLAIALTLAVPAQATVFLGSPSLPLIGVPYISPSGAGCFDIAMVCVTPGPFTLTSVVSSTFVPGDGLLLPAVQDAVADATYDATLTPIVGSTIVGSVSLKGVVDEQIKGRTSDTETGSFATDITGLSLSGKLVLSGGGPLDGATLMVTLGDVAIDRYDDHHSRRLGVQDRQFLRCGHRRFDSGYDAEQVGRPDPVGRRS